MPQNIIPKTTKIAGRRYTLHKEYSGMLNAAQAVDELRALGYATETYKVGSTHYVYKRRLK